MRHFCHRSNAALIRFRILVRTPVGFSVEIPFSALLKIFLSQLAIFVGSALGPGPFFSFDRASKCRSRWGGSLFASLSG